MTNEIRKPQIGDQIASYTIVSKLGSGGMGDVYLCDDAALGRRVAVKIMHAVEAGDKEAIARFILEGKALAKLTHPNIVSVYGLGEQNGFLYIAMEHVPGRSLYQLARDRRLSLPEMISIFADIAAGLDHAHSLGIVHRDIKPANILIDSFGRAKIIDFGIAKSIGGNTIGTEGVKTKTGAIIGTLNYIAPELFRGDPPSPLSDLYALGLIFAEMLTGRTPFKGESQFETMEKIRAGRLDIPDNLHLLLPPEMWEVLNSIIDHEPLRRPRTCTEAANKLKAIKYPDLPSYFNSELVSVRIDNVEKLQDLLEAENVDPAEWQFVLSIAVREQAMKPMQNSNEESTKLIETTAVIIPAEIMQRALESYRRDIDSIITLRRAEKISALTPPPATPPVPVAQIMAHTGSVEIKNVNKAAPVQPPPKPSAVPWISAVAVVGIVAAVLVMRQNKQQVADPRGRQVVAAPGKSDRAAVLAPSGQRSSAMAMVLEPATDAWPPVALQAQQVGPVRIWQWKGRTASGEEIAFGERRTWQTIEEGLVKVAVERLKTQGGAEISEPAGFEWYTDGLYALPSKAQRSLLFGTVSSSVVGKPEALFPLRKGKEVQFEVSFKNIDPSLKPTVSLSGAAPTPYRSACTVRDKLKLKVARGEFETVKIDCAFKADTNEVNDVVYWSAELNSPIRHDRRIVSTAGGTISETSLTGELVSESMPAAATVRAPAANH